MKTAKILFATVLAVFVMNGQMALGQSSPWTQNDDKVYVTDLNAKVGIGTSFPVEPLTVNGDAAVIGGLFTHSFTKDPASTLLQVRSTEQAYLDLAGGTDATSAYKLFLGVIPDFGYVGIFSGASGGKSPLPMRFLMGTTEVMRFDTNSNVGVGTTSPTSRVHVFDDQAAEDMNALLAERTFDNSSTGTERAILGEVTFDGGGGTTAFNITGLHGIVRHDGTGTVTHARGMTSAIEVTSSGTIQHARSLQIKWKNTGGGTIQNGYGIYMNDVPATTAYGIYQVGADDVNYFAGNVGIGTTTLTHTLTVNGTITAEEVEVVPDVPADFVFEDDYALRSLAEVERYIEAHGHLPELPSAAQMHAEGVGLSAMQMKLLQKIEELTLYLIEQHKALAAMQQENALLNERLATLETTGN